MRYTPNKDNPPTDSVRRERASGPFDELRGAVRQTSTASLEYAAVPSACGCWAAMT